MHFDDAFTPQVIRTGVIYLVALVVSITAHEFGHALVADRLGDRLPRLQGRGTLNPLAHIAPVGTLFSPILGFVLSASGGAAVASRLLGWGKPVQIPLRGVRMKPRTANLLISLAGPGSNLLLALLLS